MVVVIIQVIAVVRLFNFWVNLELQLSNISHFSVLVYTRQIFRPRSSLRLHQSPIHNIIHIYSQILLILHRNHELFQVVIQLFYRYSLHLFYL